MCPDWAVQMREMVSGDVEEVEKVEQVEKTTA
jgi:hypothetical protein